MCDRDEIIALSDVRLALLVNSALDEFRRRKGRFHTIRLIIAALRG